MNSIFWGFAAGVSALIACAGFAVAGENEHKRLWYRLGIALIIGGVSSCSMAGLSCKVAQWTEHGECQAACGVARTRMIDAECHCATPTGWERP